MSSPPPPRALFVRDARLLAGVDFARVFDTRKRVAEPLMALHWRERVAGEAGDGGPRLGLAVSRKVDKRAVGRNRIKRRLRERYRHLRPYLQARDYVVVARAGAACASHVELIAAFERLLVRAGALPRNHVTGTMAGSCP